MPLITTIGALSARALGFAKTMITDTYFFLYGGVYRTANSFNDRGIIASEEGTVIFGTVLDPGANTAQANRFDKDGNFKSALSTGTVQGLFSVPIYVDSSTTNPKWYYRAPIYYVNYTTESSPNTWQLSSSVEQSRGNAQEIDQVCANSNGVIATTNTRTDGKETNPTIFLYTSSGSVIDSRRITAGAGSNQYFKIKPRTDNNFVWYFITGSGFRSYIVTPTDAAPINGLLYTGGSGGSQPTNSLIDANNNIYAAGMPTAYSQIEVMRVNSARVPTHYRLWEVTSGGFDGYNLYDQRGTSIAQYGNFVYLMHGAYTGSPRVGYMFVVCLNAADLSFAWGKSFTSPDWNVGGANAYTGTLGGNSTSKSIWANQYGVWIAWAGGTTNESFQFTYINKLPLNGVGINGTYSVGGRNITIADYTPSLITLTTPSALTVPLASTNSPSVSPTTNATITSRSNPAPTRVLIG